MNKLVQKRNIIDCCTILLVNQKQKETYANQNR